MSDSAAQIDDVWTEAERSRKSLDKIGEGDWTPQDSQHQALLIAVLWLLNSSHLRRGRIIHGDAE